MSEAKCGFPGCDRPIKSINLCNGHYQQERKGRELRPLRSDLHPADRLLLIRSVDAPINPKTGTQCWEVGISGHDSYRTFWDGQGMVRSHRFAAMTWGCRMYPDGYCGGEYGQIPEGYEIDHDNPDFGCHNKACCNPEHLEAVPGQVNRERLKNNTSGHAGINWNKMAQKWDVQVQKNRTKYTPTIIGLASRFMGAPPPSTPPREAIEARRLLLNHLGVTR